MSTVNYLYPVNGAAPSAKAVSTVSRVVAQLVFSDTDTTAVISHNFGASAVIPGQSQSDIASGWPEVRLIPTTSPTTTVADPLSREWPPGTNAVTIGKAAQTGSAGTYLVYIDRPWTGSR